MTKATKATAPSAATAKTVASFKALQDLTNEALESAKTMREKVQRVLEGCVSHWKLTGSNEGLKQLVNGFINHEALKGVNSPAISAWAQKHLHMFVGTDAEGKPALFFKSGVNVKDLDTKKAVEENWWSLKTMTPFQFDQVTVLQKLVKASISANEKKEKALKAGREVGDVVVDDAVTAKLKEALALAQAQISALKAAEAMASKASELETL